MPSEYTVATLSDLFRSLSGRKIKPDWLIEIISNLCRHDLKVIEAARIIEEEISINGEVSADDDKLRDFLGLIYDGYLMFDKKLIAIVINLYNGSIYGPGEAELEVGVLMAVAREKRTKIERQGVIDEVRKV